MEPPADEAQELVKVDLLGQVHYLGELGLLGVEAQGPDGGPDLLSGDGPVPVLVEQVEDVLGVLGRDVLAIPRVQICQGSWSELENVRDGHRCGCCVVVVDVVVVK